jgi:hypothetical protein
LLPNICTYMKCIYIGPSGCTRAARAGAAKKAAKAAWASGLLFIVILRSLRCGVDRRGLHSARGRAGSGLRGLLVSSPRSESKFELWTGRGKETRGTDNLTYTIVVFIYRYLNIPAWNGSCPFSLL